MGYQPNRPNRRVNHIWRSRSIDPIRSGPLPTHAWRSQRSRQTTFGFLYVLESFCDWCCSLLTPTGVAHLLSIACIAVQIVCIDMFLVKFVSDWVLVPLLVEIPLMCHLAWYWREESAHRAAPVQWLSYSWVHAGKVVVLFCRVMPRLPTSTMQTDHINPETNSTAGFKLFGERIEELLSPTMLGTLLLITPVFYALLMFRISKSIFGSFSNRTTVDLIMHYDMLWHVVIDMVDQVDMFHYAQLAEMVGWPALNEHQRSLIQIQTIVPLLLFLSMALQAQALPGVAVDRWHIPEPPLFPESERFPVPAEVLVASIGVQRTLARDRITKLENIRRKRLQSIVQLIHRQSIIIARKRSAIVSIFFTDIPFLAVRLWLWALLGASYFPGLGVKNGICIALNVMQYGVVSIANQESCLDIERQLAEYHARFLGGAAQAAGDEGGLQLPKASGPADAATRSNRTATPAGLSRVATPVTAGSGGISSPRGVSPAAPAGMSPASPGWRRKVAVAERSVRNRTVRSTGICVHFWSLFVAIGAGYLLAKGEHFLKNMFTWISGPDEPFP